MQGDYIVIYKTGLGNHLYNEGKAMTKQKANEVVKNLKIIINQKLEINIYKILKEVDFKERRKRVDKNV